MSKRILIILLLFFSFQKTYCLDKPILESYFLHDSVMVGENTYFVVKYIHNSKEEFIFPDSNYNFSPFEYVDQLHFTTKTVGEISIDSIVYILRTFELKTINQFSIPISIINTSDTVKLFTNYNSLNIRSFIKELPKEPKLIAESNFLNIILRLNGVLWISVMILVIFIITLIVIFGYKPFMKFFKKYKQQKDYQSFISNFDKLKISYETNPKSITLENSLKYWKEYLQIIKKEPYSTFTSKEICQKMKIEGLEKCLSNIDKGIYGNINLNQLAEQLDHLKIIAMKEYENLNQKNKDV